MKKEMPFLKKYKYLFESKKFNLRTIVSKEISEENFEVPRTVSNSKKRM